MNNDSNGPNIILAGNNFTRIEDSGIETPKLTQTSKIEIKKNIEKIRVEATNLIRGADICKYNLKNEENTKKKHIGLVIGGKYKCPEEVISEDKQGIEIYSMTAIAWKAIQELTERVEKLEGSE